MHRRAFLGAIGVTAVWPFAPVARAQDGKPVIGFLHIGSRSENAKRLEAFWKGLGEEGFVEGQNVAIEYRWAEGHEDRLDDLAADLVRRHVTVIATPAVTSATVAAKKATSAIPIVFATGADPVRVGLVESLSRPGGNATGVTSMNAALAAKRLQIARELAPKATRFFTLVNPTSPTTGPLLEDLLRAATDSGIRVDALRAHTPEEVEAVFAGLPDAAGGVFISSPDSQFYNWRAQIVSLVARHGLVALFDVPDYVEVGGLASYGNDLLDLIRMSGVYVGRILKGEKPADLPVVQAEKFVFAVNLKTAAALGVDISPTLLAAADEVIE